MSTTLRILFVAEPDAGVEALGAVRQGGPVQAQLAPSADALRQALVRPDAATTWDAVVYIPGGPVEEVEVAVFVPDGLPLFVVDDEVPLLLSETAAQALPLSEMAQIRSRLPAPPQPGAPPSDVPAVSAVEPPQEALSVPEDDASVGASPARPAGPRGQSGEAGGPGAEASADRPPAGEGADLGRQSAPVAPPAPAPPGPAAPGPQASASGVDLTSLVEELSVALYRSTPEGKILYANPALAELLGAPSARALESVDVWTDLGYPRQQFADEIHAAGAVRNLVMSWTRQTGERVHTRETARAVLDDAGEVLYYEGVMEDVTAEVEAQREERAVARQHRAIAAFAAAATESKDPAALHQAAVRALIDATEADWACLATWNAGDVELAATAGEPPSALGGLVSSFSDRGLPAQAHAVHAADGAPGDVTALGALGAGAAGFAPVRSGGAPLGVMVWGKAEGGEVTATDVRGGQALAWHLSGHLDRARALGDLHDSEASLAVIAERTPHVLYRLRYTPEGAVFDYLSPAVESLTGYDQAGLAERGGLDGLVEHRDVRQGEGLASRPVPGADRYHAVYKMATAHGERWVENDARPWLDDGGRPVGLVGVLQDVTERKEREDRLADAAQTALIRQRALVDLSHLDGADGFGAPAASVAAATLDAQAVSLWSCPADAPCHPLYAPAPDGGPAFGRRPQARRAPRRPAPRARHRGRPGRPARGRDAARRVRPRLRAAVAAGGPRSAATAG